MARIDHPDQPDEGVAAWTAAFPALASLSAKARARLADSGGWITLPPGTPLFRPGDACRSFLMVLAGSVRVRMVAENGREVVLYRIRRGETCPLTTACLLTGGAYDAEAIAETEAVAIAVPATGFEALLAEETAFRRFVFESYATRIAGLIALIEEVAFRRIDTRLARFLVDHCDREGKLDATHQALAVELGTAREVVSRQLKEFERRGLVALARGGLSLTDREGLRRIAGPAPS
jgi:CRP/FNR family transcriptional regulator